MISTDKIKTIAAISVIVSLFAMVVTGGWLLLVKLLDQGAFSYACYGFVVALSTYFIIELYQKSR